MSIANPSPASLPPISFDIKLEGQSGFKSIRNLTWENVPGFAVLTGRNGSGKSQLLLYLAYKLNQAEDKQFPTLGELSLKTIGDTFQPGDVAYVASSGENIHNAELSIANLQNVKKQVYQGYVQRRNSSIDWLRRWNWLSKLMGSRLGSLSEEEFVKQASDDLAFMLEDQNLLHGLAHVFLGYRLQFAHELEKNVPRTEIVKKLGPAPWDVLNEILAVAEFPYRVEPPIGSLLDPYRFELKQSAITINPKDLSSGEKVILQLALWLYNSRRHNRFPRMFLLDEPDSHLHPSMTRQFMDVLQEVLVNRYKVRVIITTHSPSTVALAPEGSIFEMIRGAPKILASKSKADTIGLLTAGLVVVSRTSRFVIVEDEADVEFYSTIRGILSDYGPSKDSRALAPAPTIVFLPASSGRSVNKIGGGKGAVGNWVAKFDAPPFDELIYGVIDNDTGNATTDRIFAFQRYSIENYLIDPFVVFGLLVEENSIPPALGHISISSGDEHLIRALEERYLQEIIDLVRNVIESKLPSLSAAEKSMETVGFTNGKKAQYPNWMITRRGHDLFQVYQREFGGVRIFTPPRLTKSLQRVRFIPKELADLMHKLQKGG